MQHRTYFDFLSTRLIVGGNVDRSPNSYHGRYLEVTRDPATGRYLDYVQRDSVLTDYTVDLLNSGIYSQLEFVPVQRLKVVASLRYDFIRYDFDNALSPS